jgi:hypothetical protein
MSVPLVAIPATWAPVGMPVADQEPSSVPLGL